MYTSRLIYTKLKRTIYLDAILGKLKPTRTGSLTVASGGGHRSILNDESWTLVWLKISLNNHLWNNTSEQTKNEG